MANELALVRLEHTSGGHNKQYTIWIEKVSGGGFNVNFSYGRINGNTVSGTKTPSTPVSWSMALSLFDRLKKDKVNKGYHVANKGYHVAKKYEPVTSPKNLVMVATGKKAAATKAKKKAKKKKKPDDEPRRSLIL